jgi:hypothetical protein
MRDASRGVGRRVTCASLRLGWAVLNAGSCSSTGTLVCANEHFATKILGATLGPESFRAPMNRCATRGKAQPQDARRREHHAKSPAKVLRILERRSPRQRPLARRFGGDSVRRLLAELRHSSGRERRFRARRQVPAAPITRVSPPMQRDPRGEHSLGRTRAPLATARPREHARAGIRDRVRAQAREQAGPPL